MVHNKYFYILRGKLTVKLVKITLQEQNETIENILSNDWLKKANIPSTTEPLNYVNYAFRNKLLSLS